MKRKFIAAFFELVPLFTGLFVVTAKPAPLNLEAYISRYVCFIALFVMWNIFRVVSTELLTSKTEGSRSRISKFLFIGSLAALFIVVILVCNHRFDKLLYESSLALIGMSAFAHRFKQSGRFILFWLLALLYHTGVGFLSFQMVLFSFQWQAVLFSLAIATTPLAIALASLIEEPTNQENLLLKKLLSLALFLGPVSIALLVFSGHLSNVYLAPMLCLPILPRIIEQRDARLGQWTTLVCLVFVLYLATLGIWA